MSAFVVSDRTMQRAVTALDVHNQPAEDLDRLGQELYRLNEQAVNWRYRHDCPTDEDVSPYITWKWCGARAHTDGHYTPLDRAIACDWLKALHCLRYQMTEGKEVPETLLYARITKRIRQLETSIVTHLPEYDAAPWDA